MGSKIVAPLAGWNVRGYSYGEVTPRGERHPGADLNVGGGDDDLGLPVVCFADGTVVERLEWDGVSLGYGNAGLVEHRLFGGDGSEGGVRVWSLYGHLDGFSDELVPGARLEAGQPVGTCGKSGWQAWAHLHFEVRYMGPEHGMNGAYWGGRLSYEAQSARYADPYTVLRLLEDRELGGDGALAELMGRTATLEELLAASQADREWNYRLKMAFEGCLRDAERRNRVKRGTTDRLIAGVMVG